MKKLLTVFLGFVASVAIVYFPMIIDNNGNEIVAYTNNTSVLAQDILYYSDKPILQHKLYHDQELIGVVENVEWLNEQIDSIYQNTYSNVYKNTKMSLGQDVYIVDEYSYYKTSNIDEEIFDYLRDNQLLGIEATAIEFSTRDGVYDIIYIDDIEKFYEARDKFLLNFVSEDALKAFGNNEEKEMSSAFGSREIGMRIAETIRSKKAVAKTNELMTDVNDIYEFLCYGRNKERIYHVVQEGETLQGVGFNYSNLSPLQIMMLNPDKIYNVDQVLTPGTRLNVTYFSSPITVYVTKERLAEEVILPDTPIYVEDPNMYADEEEVRAEEKNGRKNVLYEETWVNGVLQGATVRSEYVVEEPIQGEIAVGTIPVPNIGTGNFMWPIESPRKTCLWMCYINPFPHQALDIESMYDRWGDVYAADNGTVVDVSYDSIGGNHITIDHNNGYMTYYGHLSDVAIPSVGDTVRRGQKIGLIGMTGLATGPHVHYAMYQNGTLVDPCTVLNCNSIP